jgi:hypothetical protein
VTATVVLPAGASVVEVRLTRLAGGQAGTAAAAAKRLATQLFLVPAGKAGPFRIRLNSAKLRGRLKPGVYELRVRVGTANAKLGAPTTRKFRIGK